MSESKENPPFPLTYDPSEWFYLTFRKTVLWERLPLRGYQGPELVLSG